PLLSWFSISSSADGSKLAAVAFRISPSSGLIYVSTNSGDTWIQADTPDAPWRSVASSSDGTRLIAAINGGAIYVSTNSGISWLSNSPLNALDVASSADGARLAALVGGSIYTSTNCGASWSLNNAPGFFWTAISSSADGCRSFATEVNERNVYTSQSTPTPRLSLALSSGQATLSWLIPSTSFDLQQNLDLSTSNWLTVTNGPTLNFSNLENQIVLPLNAASSFYRLKTP